MGKLVVHRFLLAFHGIGTARRPGEAQPRVSHGAGEAFWIFLTGRFNQISKPKVWLDYLEDLGLWFKIRYSLDCLDSIFDWLQQILDRKEIHRRPRGDSSCAVCLCEFEGQRDVGNRRFQVGFKNCAGIIQLFGGHQTMQYCWWLKSCTTWAVSNPVNNEMSYLLIGAGVREHTP